MLAELTRKREIQKLKQTQLVHDLISTFFFPHAPELRSAFERIIAYVYLMTASYCLWFSF